MSAIPFRSHGDRFYRYIGVNFTFGLLDCDRYIGDIVKPWIVKSGFCSIHFTVTMDGLKNVTRYIGNIVISKIVISAFHCILSDVFINVKLKINKNDNKKAYLKNLLKLMGYPYCSASPAQTTLADAPIRVPFPVMT